MHGEYPDPSILKDGADYYMVNCSQPLMWHSQDLLHWEPLYELSRYGITGGAADLCKVGDTYYIYNVYPFGRDKTDYKPTNMWVLTTRDIRSGIWDGPFDVPHRVDRGRLVPDTGRRGSRDASACTEGRQCSSARISHEDCISGGENPAGRVGILIKQRTEGADREMILLSAPSVRVFLLLQVCPGEAVQNTNDGFQLL